MRHRPSVFALIALLPFAVLLGCDSADNPIAPSGSVLTISANPTQIDLNGSATLTVTGFRPDGNPLNPGTQVRLTTDLGVLSSSIVEVTDGGRAVGTLRGDGRTGPATITASLTNAGTADSGATVTVQVGSDDSNRPTLVINATPANVDLGDSATVSVLARQADNSPFANAQVRLRTTLGSLASGTLTTNSNGEASTTFRAGDQPGTATISGTVGSSEEAETTIEITDGKPTLLVQVNPNTVRILETASVSIIARDENGLPLGSGERVFLTSNAGTFERNGNTIDSVTTDSSGRAAVTFRAGTQAITSGEICAVLRNSDQVCETIQVIDAAASFTFTVNKTTVNAGGDSLVLTATVVNADGLALNGTLVRFDSDLGGTFDPSSSVTTGSDGQASTTITYADTVLISGETFTVGAIVRIGDSDVTQERTITVQ
ncbi:MAG: invasin domain 3-containing protein [Acidobacteriota bacterium]